jgi:hypothetical protein
MPRQTDAAKADTAGTPPENTTAPTPGKGVVHVVLKKGKTLARADGTYRGGQRVACSAADAAHLVKSGQAVKA